MIVGIVGRAGSGKDLVGNMMVERGYAAIALADPMKEFCAQVFGWSRDVLWGASELREMADKRSNVWVCPSCGWFGQPHIEPDHYGCGGCGARLGNEHGQPLSPRLALQTLGTEFGRALYPEIWTDLAIRRVNSILDKGLKFGKDPFVDSVRLPKPDTLIHGLKGVIITDVRFVNEAQAIRNECGKLLHIVRPSADNDSRGIEGHASETEQDSIPNEWYDCTISNSGTIADLEVHVNALLQELHKGDTDA